MKVAHEQRAKKAKASTLVNSTLLCIDKTTDLCNPALMIKHLKLEQDLGHSIVISNDGLGIWGVEYPGQLLEKIHGLLDATVQLPSPHDLPCDRREVWSNGGLCLLFGVNSRDHLNVPAKVLQNLLVLLTDAQVWDAKPGEIEKRRKK